MLTRKSMSLAAASIAAAGVVGVGLFAGATNAFADPSAPPTTGTTQSGGQSQAGTPSAGTDGATRPDRAAQHTEVTGDEADKVAAAVKAKDAAVTVTKVEKDADGSYDVLGTKDGANVRYEVSADLATVTLDEGRGGKGGPGGASQDTPVTGAEADTVIAAVKAKDAAVNVESVRKDPDGSFDALGTKDGAKVFVEVSSDLQTVTVNTGR